MTNALTRRLLLLAPALALPVARSHAAAPRQALVMFERPGCSWCLRWKREVGLTYDQSPEARLAPLRLIDIWANPDHGLRLKEPVRFTPTFVVLTDGIEAGRITGYIDNASFWGLFTKLLDPALSHGETPEPV